MAGSVDMARSGASGNGIGGLEVRRPKMRDRAACPEEEIRFTSAILPKWDRHSISLGALRTRLDLLGISTEDFHEPLDAILGEDAPHLLPSVIVRLNGEWQQEYDRWQHRDLLGRQ